MSYRVTDPDNTVTLGGRVNLPRPPQIVKKADVPRMSRAQLIDARDVLGRLLRQIDGRLSSTAASDRQADDEDGVLALRVEAAKRALYGDAAERDAARQRTRELHDAMKQGLREQREM